MNACWSRVPGVAYCFGDELADDGVGDAVGVGAADWDGLDGAGLTFAGAGAGAELGCGAVLAADSPRSRPVARTPGTAAFAGWPVPTFRAADPAPGMPPVPASATASGRPGTVAVAASVAFAGATLALAGARLPDCGAVLTAWPGGSPVAGWRLPLSTKPAMPWSASGAAEEWTLTVRPGRESAAMVSRTPPE